MVFISKKSPDTWNCETLSGLKGLVPSDCLTEKDLYTIQVQKDIARHILEEELPNSSETIFLLPYKSFNFTNIILSRNSISLLVPVTFFCFFLSFSYCFFFVVSIAVFLCMSFVVSSEIRRQCREPQIPFASPSSDC